MKSKGYVQLSNPGHCVTSAIIDTPMSWLHHLLKGGLPKNCRRSCSWEQRAFSGQYLYKPFPSWSKKFSLLNPHTLGTKFLSLEHLLLLPRWLHSHLVSGRCLSITQEVNAQWMSQVIECFLEQGSATGPRRGGEGNTHCPCHSVTTNSSGKC